MLERFRDHLLATALIPEGSTVLVGYSGGGDSTCLLHLLHENGQKLIAAHLHHGQRPEADEELAKCAEVCEGIGVPFASGRADVPKIARDMGIGLEEAGRNARYEFFEQCRHQTQSDLIATAHTLDDHVETVLLNLARGTGLHGLSGIAETRGRIVRPLLTFSRAETREYCLERGWWFHDDPANDDIANSRVRVRKNVVPELEQIHPKAKEAINRLSQNASAEDRFLDGMAAAALEQCEKQLNGSLSFVSEDCEVAFVRESLLTLPRVLLARAIRLAVGALGASLSQHQTATCIDGIASGQSGSVTPEGGEVVIEWDDETVLARSLRVDEPYRFPLTNPGETISDEFGWKISVQSAPLLDFMREPRSLDVVIDAGAVKGSLYFRSCSKSDSIQPLGMAGKKLVGDVMSSMGLTQATRRRLPIVCDLVGPVWVPGGCIDERVKVTEATHRCIRLSFEPC